MVRGRPLEHGVTMTATPGTTAPPRPAPRPPGTSPWRCSRWPPAGSRSAPPSSSRWACSRRSPTGSTSRSRPAGHVISAYALGVVVGAPLIAFFGARLAAARAAGGADGGVRAVQRGERAGRPATSSLMVARFLDGLPHGAYFGVASLVAASLAPAGRKGRAVALVMLGLSVANVVGVPAATWLGQTPRLARGLLGGRRARPAHRGPRRCPSCRPARRPGGDRPARAQRRSRSRRCG